MVPDENTGFLPSLPGPMGERGEKGDRGNSYVINKIVQVSKSQIFKFR